MGEPQNIMASSGVCKDPHGLLERLDALRAALGPVESASELEALLAGISEAVSAVMTEHSGMGEELLCVYEQLGIVFELTSNLLSVQEDHAVVDLFVNSLGRTFKGSQVFAAYKRASGDWALEDRVLESGDWLSSVIDKALAESAVLVDVPPEGVLPESVREVMAGPLRCGDQFVCAVVLMRGDEAREFRAGDMLLVESLTMFCGDLIKNQHLITELREASMAMVCSLVSAVDQKDPYTSGHSQRVGYFAMLLGQELALSHEDLQMLQWSALLHDIGKIGIRDDVLKKKGKLSDEERRHIMEHPVRSHEVVKDVPQLRLALDGVLHHHEHYDGKGYPDGLAGEDIPLQARIIQVADVFDALTSTRSYRKSFEWPRALDILEEESGTTVDPHIQRVFDRLIRDLLEDGSMSWEMLVARAESPNRTGPMDPQVKRLEEV